MNAKNNFRLPVPRLFLLPLTFILIVSLACNLPGLVRPNPTATPTPSVQTPIPTSQPSPTSRPPANLPPTLVEATPLSGSEIALKAPIVLAFNQSMNKSSVEGALQGQPTLSGKITWIDDLTLSFTPDQALLPATKVSLTINTTAKAANGLALSEPVTIQYTTAEPLRLVDSLPSDGVTDAAPSSAVVATFNQPVVPLGSENNSDPQAFTLQPSVPGHGEWINTSTYIYYPEPALGGGTTYTVQLNSSLTSTNGTTLADGTKASWSFTTATPRVDSVDPAAPTKLKLDGPIVINFNITMDSASVESNFSLKNPTGNSVPGKFTWNDSKTSLTFVPDNLLARSTNYTLSLNGQAQAFGGVSLGSDYTDQLQTYSSLSILQTDPAQGETMQSYGGGFGTLTITFDNPIKTGNLSQPGRTLATPAAAPPQAPASPRMAEGSAPDRRPRNTSTCRIPRSSKRLECAESGPTTSVLSLRARSLPVMGRAWGSNGVIRTRSPSASNGGCCAASGRRSRSIAQAAKKLVRVRVTVLPAGGIRLADRRPSNCSAL